MTGSRSRSLVSKKSFRDLFPFENPRENQIETVEKIIKSFSSGKKYVVLEAPTGTGKSPIGIAISNYYSNCHIITPQKILQKQYKRDFDFLYNMMGKSNYLCDKELDRFKKQMLREPVTRKEIFETSCASGLCQKGVKTECSSSEFGEQEYTCPYKIALNEATISKKTLHNFDSFFYQRRWFQTRELMIIDEAHNTEGKFMNFISFTISNKDIGGTIPKLEKIEDYKSFLSVYMDNLNKYIKMCISKNEYLRANEAYDLSEKIKLFLSVSDQVKFVFEYKDNKSYQSVRFKPIYISPFTPTLFGYGERILLMSATILNYEEFIKNIGIPENEAEFISVDSTFPIESRQICYTGELDLKWDRSIGGINPDMLKKIPKIIDKYLKMYEGERGIIHTHTNHLMSLVRESNNKRFTFKSDFKTDKEMMEEHRRKSDSVLVGSGFAEGLDLKDDLSRFQVILKIPYPDLSDKQISERMKIDKDYYPYLTSLKLVQSYGRSVRSKDDYCDTYIIDRAFRMFYGINKKMLPKWFREAIVW